MKEMGPEGNAAVPAATTTATSCSSPSTPCGKRIRDPEDEVYVDNLHSHKRYLSEIMASSLNGLTVGDTLSENLMESPARDELSLQYSPMSEDYSDDSRYYESPTNTCSSQPESVPTSPVSPYRSQKPLTAFASNAPSASSYPSPRQRGSETEARFPSSPSDICHSADLRRAALLRSVQMRTQPLGSLQFESSVQESGNNNVEPIIDTMSIENGEKFCETLVMNLKEDKSEGE